MEAITIGRRSDCDVVIEDATVSRHHARLRRRPSGTWLVEDLHSKNGTAVNGVPIAGPTRIEAGDVLGFGARAMRFGG